MVTGSDGKPVGQHDSNLGECVDDANDAMYTLQKIMADWGGEGRKRLRPPALAKFKNDEPFPRGLGVPPFPDAAVNAAASAAAKSPAAAESHAEVGIAAATTASDGLGTGEPEEVMDVWVNQLQPRTRLKVTCQPVPAAWICMVCMDKHEKRGCSGACNLVFRYSQLLPLRKSAVKKIHHRFWG